MNARDFDERVTIQTATLAKSDAGEQTKTWADVATVWAKVKEQRASERRRAEKLESVRRITVTIRHRTDVAAEDRIQHRGRAYEVIGTTEIDRKKYLEILCTYVEP